MIFICSIFFDTHYLLSSVFSLTELGRFKGKSLICLPFMYEVIMDTTLLFLLPEGMLIEEMQATETGLCLTVRATHPTSCCPLCFHPSSSIHSHYQRRLNDTTCAGRQVQLSLTVRRFYCRNRLCGAKSLQSACHALWSPGLV
jgi:hypothetical protein